MSRQSDSAYRVLQTQPAALPDADRSLPDAPPEPVPVPEPAPTPPLPTPFEAMTEAEQYAVLHPERVRRIRDAGGLPERLDFGPPDPEFAGGHRLRYRPGASRARPARADGRGMKRVSCCRTLRRKTQS